MRLLTTHITIGADTGDDAAKKTRRRALQGEQIAAVASAAASAGERVVLMGDFNVGPDDPRLDPVERAGLQEADRGRNAPTGNNRIDAPGSAADRKIDYMFLEGVEQVGGAGDVLGPELRPPAAGGDTAALTGGRVGRESLRSGQVGPERRSLGRLDRGRAGPAQGCAREMPPAPRSEIDGAWCISRW